MIGMPPDCLKCKHFHYATTDHSCDAYPHGIPEDIYIKGEKHLEVRSDQIGNLVYEYYPEAEE
jgi:hypothetical protein